MDLEGFYSKLFFFFLKERKKSTSMSYSFCFVIMSEQVPIRLTRVLLRCLISKCVGHCADTVSMVGSLVSTAFMELRFTIGFA